MSPEPRDRQFETFAGVCPQHRTRLTNVAVLNRELAPTTAESPTLLLIAACRCFDVSHQSVRTQAVLKAVIGNAQQQLSWGSQLQLPCGYFIGAVPLFRVNLYISVLSSVYSAASCIFQCCHLFILRHPVYFNVVISLFCGALYTRISISSVYFAAPCIFQCCTVTF
jgi:hypothetical protein